MKQLWAPWRMTYVSEAATEPDGCIFCDFAVDENSDQVVEQTGSTVSVVNRFPYASGHLLIAPARHVVSLSELDDAESLALIQGVTRATDALQATFSPDGFNVGINLGRAAGGSIGHLHLHVVPRWSGDTNFMPVLADVKVLPEHLEETAERLRQAYSARQSKSG